MSKEIFLFKSYSDEDCLESVRRVLERGTFWANGPEISEFEKRMAEFSERRYAVALNSGTSALYANLLSHGITSGEVIVPSFTFPATANSVEIAGARPVFADIERETLGLDIEDVKKRITEDTKAIMPIHFAGAVSRDIRALSELAKQYEIPLIEDNAQSLGATLDNQKTGTFGDSSVTSFCFNKVLTTGEGGMVFTDNEEQVEKLKLLRSHGRAQNKDYTIAGMNLRMPTVCAALGLSQLEKLPQMIQSRREMAEFYDSHLSGLTEVKPLTYPDSNQSVYCTYNVLFKDAETRDNSASFLKEKGIPTRSAYSPTHLYSFYIEKYGHSKGDLSVTEDISKRGLTIPLHLGLRKKDLEYIAQTLKELPKT